MEKERGVKGKRGEIANKDVKTQFARSS